MSANEQLAETLHKSAIRKFKGNIWAAVLAEIGSLSSKNQHLLCVIGVFTKCKWVKEVKM